MGKKRENVNWQPLSILPQISNMIEGMLDAAKETYEPLCQIKVHDDFTIKRIFQVTGQQIEDEWMYDKQLERWSNLPDLKTAQQNEILRLQGQMAELKKVNRDIMAIAKEHKDKTIEKVLEKDDAELAFEFLTGKLKL